MAKMNTTQILTGIKNWSEDKFAQKSDATEGNLAKFDANGNPVDAGIAAEKVAQKGEIQTYSGNLVDTRSAGTAQEFTYRKSGGDGVNWMRRIKGKSLVWNQLSRLGASETKNGITFTANSDGTVTIDGTAEQDVFVIIFSQVAAISTHTYLGYTNDFVVGSYGACRHASLASGNFQFIQTGKFNYGIRVASGVTVNNVKIRYKLIDLTLMCGEGKEPSTVKEFEDRYNEPYYPYQSGIIVNNDVESLETVGFNQWDESQIEGGYVNDANGEIKTNVYAKNTGYIRVLPGVDYYIKTDATIGKCGAWYDADKNYISGITGAGIKTSPSNACYMRFTVMYNNTGDPDSFCINLSDASRNGTYEPYWKKSIQLGLKAFRVTDGTNIITVNGLKSAGPVYDEIDPVRKKHINRIEEVDLGTLTFSYSTIYNAFYTSKITFAQNLVGKVICSKYSSVNGVTNLVDKSLTGNNEYNRIYIKDSSFDGTTPEGIAAFKAAMSGVMLQAALATPVEYDLVDDIPNAIEVDENGTERAIFPEAVDPSAPFAADSNYSVSTANLVRKLNDAS